MEARKMLMEQGRGTAADQSFVQQVCSKWNPLLEGIQDPYQRGVMGILLENQMDHLKQLNEETLSTGVGSFTKYIFPILRRVFPNLIANQIVSVQPMTAPVGGIFTYEYKYADAKGQVAAGENLVENFNRLYSSEYIDYQLVVAKVDTDGAEVKWTDAKNPKERIPVKWLPIAEENDGKGISYLSFNWTSGGLAMKRSVTADGADAAAGDGASATVNLASGAFELDTTGDTPDAATGIYVTYWYDSENVHGDVDQASNGISDSTYAATRPQVSKIPEVNIDISLTTVTAVTRKLKARWSAEAMDDLRAFHGLNAETELVAGISNEIALELDREIIDDLVQNAKFSANYTYDVSGAATGGNELSSIRSLLTMIESVSAKIHTGSMRAPANFIVTSPQIGALISQLTTHGDFMMVNQAATQPQAPGYGPMNSNFGVQRVGTLMNKYAVYQDPFLASDKVLVGLKGASFLDAGYVYAPYIPLQVTPTFLDPDDFTFRKGLRTRYAKKMLRAEYYGVLTVGGLPTVSG